MALNHTDLGDSYRGKDWVAGRAGLWGTSYLPQSQSFSVATVYADRVSEEHIFIPFSTCWDALYPWRGKDGAGNVN